METTPRSHHLPSSFFFILLLTIYLLPVSSSTKTETPKSSNKATTSVAVELIHADANNKLTYQQHIHAALRRTQHRAVQHMLDTKRGGYHRLNPSPLPQQAATVEMPLRGYQAEYLMTLAIGTPPTSLSATIDTGSTLIWTRCYQPTSTQHQPVFDPQNSSSYSKVPCSDPICKVNDVLSGCNGVDCSFMAQYADRSTSTGLLGWETFTLGSNSMRVKVGFGCSFRTKGFESFDTAGIVGFNRGSLSLISQLGPMIDHQFSYCLGGYSSSNQSKLTLGPIDRSIRQNATTFAPLLVNPVAPEHYFVALLGISVGGKRLPISDSAFRFHSDGSGGVVVDSGSTLTGLVQEAYSLLKEAFIEETGKPSVNSTYLQLDACFHGLLDSVSLPTLTFHFEGGDLEVPLENYILTDQEDQLSCLAILPSPAPVNLIGATTLQNFLVHFDLGRNVVTFTHVQCSRL